MIYLDNAATTFPKPEKVILGHQYAMRKLGANPGRSGHKLSLETAESIFRCRENIADFFGADGAEQVIFTLNCTMSVNFVLKGLLSPGDHCIVSSLEHNAVRRPLEQLKKRGIEVTEVAVDPYRPMACAPAFEAAIRENTRLIFCMHASNVLGVRLPIEEIGEICKRRGILFGVDAAQSAGILRIHMQEMNISFLCMPGHKGLYGPMGTGVLIARDPLGTILEGGTGSLSASPEPPEEYPDRLESGTVNAPGIYALDKGVEFVRTTGRKKILRHEMELIDYCYDKLSRMTEIELYTARPSAKTHVPVLPFNIRGMSSNEVAQQLSGLGVAVRAGLHCTPNAHRCMGTLERGAVRVAPSVFTSWNDMKTFIKDIHQIILEKEKH